MSKPTIIIVPGSFTHATAYENLASILTTQHGYDTVVGTLQSTLDHRTTTTTTSSTPPAKPATMQEDAAYFRGMIDALSSQGKDVVVVGHSFGGVVATESVKTVTKYDRQAAQRKGGAIGGGGVVRVVYLAALVTEVGETAIEAMGGQMGKIIKIMGEYMHLNIDAAATYFYEGLPPDRILEEGHRNHSRTQSTLSFMDPCTYAAVDHIPVTYIHTTKDNIVPLERQQAMVEKLKMRNAENVSILNVEESHMLNVVAPEKTAKAIVDAITRD